MHTAEKIETIVQCFLRNRTATGTFGSIVPVEADPALGVPACYRVVADGRTCIVRTDRDGWRVSFGPSVARDPDLYTAAKLAIDGRRGDVGTVAAALGLT